LLVFGRRFGQRSSHPEKLLWVLGSVLALLAAIAAFAAPRSSHQLKTSADLVRALSSASGGDEVVLAPGVYSGVKLAGINIPGGVTIRSADASNAAVFQGLRIEDSSGCGSAT
jgi:hypothetical protein